MTRKVAVAVLMVLALTGCGKRMVMGPEVAEVVTEPETHGEGHSQAVYIMLANGGECGCEVCQ